MFLIVAVSQNFVIGKNNTLPWHIKEDLKRFKQITTNCAVIMGNKTFQSIFEMLKKPLPNRYNIVISRDYANLNARKKELYFNQQTFQDSAIEGTENEKNLIFASSLQNAIEVSKNANYNENNTCIIGGSQIYKEAIEGGYVKKIYLTVVNKNVEGDAFFPSNLIAEFKEVKSEEFIDPAEGSFSFKELIKV